MSQGWEWIQNASQVNSRGHHSYSESGSDTYMDGPRAQSGGADKSLSRKLAEQIDRYYQDLILDGDIWPDVEYVATLIRREVRKIIGQSPERREPLQ